MRNVNLSDSEMYFFKYYYRKFRRIATNRFLWEFEDRFKAMGRTIEKYLWENGECIIFKHPKLDWICTRCTVTGKDVNNYPNHFIPIYDIMNDGITNYRPILVRYNDGEFKDNNCIYITDTRDDLIRSSMVVPMIFDIVDVKETLRTQIFNQNTPLMAFAGNPKTKQIVKTIFAQKNKNAKFYIVDEDVTENLKALNFNAPFNIEPLTNYLHELENEVLEWLALDNTQVFQKKERMITDEVESNNDILSTLYYDCYYPRKLASDLMNKCGLTNTLNEIIVKENEDKKDGEQDGTDEPDNTDNQR